MKKYFNLKRYKELLELEEKGEISCFNSELVSLCANVERQIIYNRKKEYFIVIDNYLNQVIAPDDFQSKISKMVFQDTRNADAIIKDFQKLEVFTLATDLEQFYNLVIQYFFKLSKK